MFFVLTIHSTKNVVFLLHLLSLWVSSKDLVIGEKTIFKFFDIPNSWYSKLFSIFSRGSFISRACCRQIDSCQSCQCSKSLVKAISESSRPEVFLRKRFLKICSKFTAKHQCRKVISIKLQSKFFEITLRHGCSPVNELHIFRTPFPKNISGWLLLNLVSDKYGVEDRLISFNWLINY